MRNRRGTIRLIFTASARAKARRLGIIEETQEAEERHARAAEQKPRRQTVHLLGRDIPVLAADDGTLRAEDYGKPSSAKGVEAYIARAFGARPDEARSAMEALAASLPPEELNRVGFRIYERFRPDVPEGAQGWGRRASCGRTGLSGWRVDRRAPGTRQWYAVPTVQPGKGDDSHGNGACRGDTAGRFFPGL